MMFTQLMMSFIHSLFIIIISVCIILISNLILQPINLPAVHAIPIKVYEPLERLGLAFTLFQHPVDTTKKRWILNVIDYFTRQYTYTSETECELFIVRIHLEHINNTTKLSCDAQEFREKTLNPGWKHLFLVGNISS